MNHKILFVDDEENILKALRRLMKKSGYDSFFASGGEEALKQIHEQQFSVIVSDMRMPVMSGVELIRKVNEIDRLSVKIILSGYSDIDDIMSAVNGGHIHSYITKPWRDTDLMITLMNACEMYERRIKEREMLDELKQKNEELYELNSNLERIVEARTREIRASNMLLNSILKGADETEVLGQGVKLLSKLLGGSPAAIYSLNSKKSYSSGDGAPLFPPDRLKDLQHAQDLKEYPDSFYFALAKQNSVFGIVAVAGNNEKNRKAVKRLNNFFAGIRLFLYQQKAIGTSSEIISSIDMLIEEVDA